MNSQHSRLMYVNNTLMQVMSIPKCRLRGFLTLVAMTDTGNGSAEAGPGSSSRTPGKKATEFVGSWSSKSSKEK